jgi:AcrR family transcriptional regulator
MTPTSNDIATASAARARSRAKLLAAATELLVERGPRSVTVDAVAERSGVAKSTLYRQWRSVDEMMVDVVRANTPAATEVDVSAGFEPSLRRWMSAAASALSAPDWPRVLVALLELRHGSPEMAEVLDADFADKVGAIAEILAIGSAEGRLPDGLDPRMVALTLVGPLVLASLRGDGAVTADLSEFVLERFVASFDAPLA